MNPDSELRRLLQAPTDRLHDQIARQFRLTLDQVAIAARTDRQAAIDNAVASPDSTPEMAINAPNTGVARSRAARRGNRAGSMVI